MTLGTYFSLIGLDHDLIERLETTGSEIDLRLCGALSEKLSQDVVLERLGVDGDDRGEDLPVTGDDGGSS